jgi:retron-type reverse transcriptase
MKPGLEGRLYDLHSLRTVERIERPSRRVYIPKPMGGNALLGIAALEDKIVQQGGDGPQSGFTRPTSKAFHGFRPGRGLASGAQTP